MLWGQIISNNQQDHVVIKSIYIIRYLYFPSSPLYFKIYNDRYNKEIAISWWVIQTFNQIMPSHNVRVVWTIIDFQFFYWVKRSYLFKDFDHFTVSDWLLIPRNLLGINSGSIVTESNCVQPGNRTNDLGLLIDSQVLYLLNQAGELPLSLWYQ